MKKILIYLNIILIFVFAFSSCKQKTIRTVEKDLEQSYSLTGDTANGTLKVAVNVEIPVCFDNRSVLDTIRNTIITNLFGPEYLHYGNDTIVKKFVENLVTDYRETNLPLLEQLDSTSLYSFRYEHSVEGFTLLSDNEIYSYGINRYVFMGGAHGLNNAYYFVFDLHNGRRLTENDIFVSGFESRLTEIIKQRIVEQSKEDGDEPIMSLEDTDYWVESIKPNGNFYITDESVNYVFNPYEIAPYYMGQTEVVIPFARLKSVLQTKSVLTHLIGKKTK